MNFNGFNAEKVFIVAEIGNNHEGNFENAINMIKAAAEAKVDAVKFQTINPSNFITSKDQARIDQLNKFKLSNDQFIRLSEEANKLGLIFFSTPFDFDSADFLNTLQPIFKISSGDNNFHQLIEKVFNYEKSTIISTGLSAIRDLDIIYNNWSKRKSSFDLAFLHCVSSYPVPFSQANLSKINFLRKRYPDVLIGYSDHTQGIEVSCAAVANGAKIIEKHFTLDKNFSDFRDHQLSSDPEEMKLLVNKIREIESMFSFDSNKLQECEEVNLISMRRSIAANQNIKSNTKIEEYHLTWLRPGNALPPGQEKFLIGKILKKDVLKGQIFTNDLF